MALEHFPERADFRFIATNGTEGKPPAETSRPFDWTGWAVMRSGRDRDARYLLFDSGPPGFGHMHEDKLSFVLHAYGSQLVMDSGSYSYDYAMGSYGDGKIETFGKDRKRLMTHTRRILFVKPDFRVVIDTLAPNDQGEHGYETLLHLDAATAAVDPAARSAIARSASGAGLAILAASRSPLWPALICGQREPELQGWLCVGRNRKSEPRPVVVYSQRATGPVTDFYVFAPFRDGREPGVKSAEMIAGADAAVGALLRFDGGATAEVTLDSQGEVAYRGAGRAFDSRRP